MDTITLLRGFRFIDSFFPSGGYAFSSGLEAAVQGGVVRNAEDLSRYIDDLLRNGVGLREAVAVGRAQHAAVDETLQVAIDADQDLEAMKIGRESRMASRQMGRQVIRIACDQGEHHAMLHDFHGLVESDRTPGHLPVVLGLTLGAIGWSRTEAIAAYLYQTATGLVSASLKLLPIGQREAQRLLESWLPLIDELSQEAASRTEMTSWTPIQDIYTMRHGSLSMRLFRS
jgi:urease accessory protein